MTNIVEFKGKYRFLSNFHPVEITMIDGITYPSVEHAFQAQKTTNLEDRRRIAKLVLPGDAKREGKRLKVRDDWEAIKIVVMKSALLLKFANEDLRNKLFDTGKALLIEGNTWGDNFWGVCRGSGKNHLGVLLMDIRDKLLR